MNKEQKWINDLSKHAGDYKRKAPEGLLDDIKREMSRRGVMPSAVPKSKKMTIVWGRRIAAAAAILLAVVLVVRNIPRNGSPVIADILNPRAEAGNGQQPTANGNGNGAATNSGAVTGEGQTEAASSGTGLGQMFRSLIYNVKDEGGKLIASITGADAQSTDGSGLIADNTIVGSSADGTAAPSAPLSQSGSDIAESRQSQMAAKRRNAMPQNWYGSGDHASYSASTGGHSGFSMAMNYSGMGSTSAGVSGNIMDASGVSAEPVYEGNCIRDFEYLPVAASEMTTHAHHDMPVKLGLSVRYGIGSRWNVQTGVNYSYLSSDITRENNLEEYDSKQKLHYVSIPLTASYSVWQNKNFNVYLSTGAEAAKLVSGKATVTHSELEGRAGTNTTTESISEHRMQYSVNGAAGVEYKAGSRISIYAEPGVSHYFNNHSSVVNIYKDKPTQFTINVGLRLNLGGK